MGLDNPIHIAFLLILLLLVFGAKRLPEMGRSLGEGMHGFKQAIGGATAHDSASAEVAPSTAKPDIAPSPAKAEMAASPVKVDIAPTPIEVDRNEAA